MDIEHTNIVKNTIIPNPAGMKDILIIMRKPLNWLTITGHNIAYFLNYNNRAEQIIKGDKRGIQCKKPGRKSHHPLIAFVADSRKVKKPNFYKAGLLDNIIVC
jgi:hypothetical protein